jgi:hypothetical protein
LSKLKVKTKINIKKSIGKLKDITIKVGFPKMQKETRSTDKKGVTALSKANRNNFGLGVPKRPFMDIAYFKNESKYRKIIQKNFSDSKNLGKYIRFSNKLGLVAVADIQKTIEALKTPQNSPYTVSMKKSSNPLIDTGHMLQSVTYALGKN